MPVVPLFVKRKYDAAEMYLGNGTHSGKMKPKSLILKQEHHRLHCEKDTAQRLLYQYWSVELHTQLKITLTQKDIWL